ncbi:MAG: helix-turn-helix transcriptional regulator [Chloroflexi bacterium]|nr:helix-turn-helix transcriptional regulator [Chloroflexota bacterium]MYJ93154.1 helix-turn-helix transcriptional regulator [Chloroflexota bacterium]
MRMRTGDTQLLSTLAAMPFLDRLELAAISGRSPAAVYQRLDRFAEAGLVETVRHATELVPRSRRYCLSATGVRRLAAEQGAPSLGLLRNYPVSEQWRRLILERLDAAAAIYALCVSASEFCHPLRFRWFRADPVDAELELSGGRRVVIVRQGRTADRTAFAKRIRRLQRTSGCSAVLLICPDEPRLRHARRLISGSSAISFLALEHDVVLQGANADIWRGPSGAVRLNLRETLSFVAPASGRQPERPLSRCTMPRSLDLAEGAELWLTSTRLSMIEKRALDLIADWTWIRPLHLASLLGVGRRRLAQLLRRLDELNLIDRVAHAGYPRLAVSDEGLAAMARRDRVSVGNSRKRWSVRQRQAGAPLDWRNVQGIRSRQLLRHIDHTESVHWFAGQLADQARDRGVRALQLDPPHRASRYFRHHDRLRSIHPDAYVLLHLDAGPRAFFLEWERRAVRPATMLARLAPYLRYYATPRPLEDHGIIPALLVVFEDPLVAGQFLRVAELAITRSAASLPLRVSHREHLETVGALGADWGSLPQGVASGES